MKVGIALPDPPFNGMPGGSGLDIELMAAIGLTHARPKRGETKLEYRYGVIGSGGETLHPPPLLRAALGGARLPWPTRTFRMLLDWPGQENQARCITDVTEDPRA